jgi:hypothetical protein
VVVVALVQQEQMEHRVEVVMVVQGLHPQLRVLQ